MKVSRNYLISANLLIVALFIVFYFLIPISSAQSWSQYKELALEAESKKDFGEAEKAWHNSLDSCREDSSLSPRKLQSLLGLAKCLDSQNKIVESETQYQVILKDIQPNMSELNESQKEAILTYISFLEKQNKIELAQEIKAKYKLNTSQISPKETSSEQKENKVSVLSSLTNKELLAQEKKIAQERFNDLLKEINKNMATKNFSEAEKLLKITFTISEKYPENNASLTEIIQKLISLYISEKKYAQAEPLCLKQVGITRQYKGAISIDFVDSLKSYAHVLRLLNRKEDAMKEEAKAESILAKIQEQKNAGTEALHLKFNPNINDVTRKGSLLQRAKGVQKGFGGMVTDMLNNPD